MSFSFSKRLMRFALGTALVVISAGAFAQSFDQLLGDFAQRRSGVCVIYAHVMAVAENDPAAFTKTIKPVFGGWMVYFHDGRRTYVPQSVIDLSIRDSYSCGAPDNKLTIACIALSMRGGGFNATTGALDYGKLEFTPFAGTGNWTGYGEESGPDHTLLDGLARIASDTDTNGKIKEPATIGFGMLDKKNLPNYAAQAEKYRLVGGHDFEVYGYNASKKLVILRNPHRPKELVEVPSDFLAKIPCGIDFMELNPINS